LSPTPTPIPDELLIGDIVTDGRVSLGVTDNRYNPNIALVNNVQFIIGFDLVFTNNSGEDVFLQLTPNDFSITDNMDREFECAIFTYPTFYSEFTRQMGTNSSVKFQVLCGKGHRVSADMEWIKLHVDQFTSLPELNWKVEIPR
jgi:hypothetical protein